MLPEEIRRLEVKNHILNPAEAELWLTLTPADLDSNLELRGRLVGPRCHFATTVEVAYPLRPFSDQRPKSGALAGRIIIPEPSLWDPESPFLYHGSVELWTNGRRSCAVEIAHGLRVLQLGKGGLRCNGRAFQLHGVSRLQLSEEDALRLRREGYNLLLSPVSAETAPLWDAADRFGFLVLGRLNNIQAIPQVESLKSHASCFGWLLPAEAPADGALPGAELARLQKQSGLMLGLEVERRPPHKGVPGIHFLFGKEESLPLEEGHLPVLLKGPSMSGSSGILGWIAE